MKKRISDPAAKTAGGRYFPRKTITPTASCEARVGAAILTLCLFFVQAGMAATGTVNYNTVYQQLEGFGGAAVYDPTSLTSHSQREAIYDLLFKDLGLDVLRIRNCVGYDDSAVTATKTIVAAARQTTRNPALKLELVPWSPPGAYKSTGSSTGGTLAKSGGLYVYAAYADWWADSLETWATNPNGLVPDYISIQNEPDIETSYDSCKFLPNETTSFAGYDQAFEAVYNEIYSRLGSSMPKMLAPETMGITGGSVGGAGPYIDALVNRGQINNVYGFSNHLYSDGTGNYDIPDDKIPAMQTFAANYGDYYNKPLFMTEYGANGTPTFAHAVLLAQHIYNCLVYEGVTSYYHWSLFRSSSTGGFIHIDSSSAYSIRDLYYFFKHYSYFTDPNWYLIGASTDSSNLRMTAFKNPGNDELTVVILNKSTSSENITLTLNGCSPDDSEVYRSSQSEHWLYIGAFTQPLSLPAQSITTISFSVTIGPQQTLVCSSTNGGSVTTPGEGSFQYAQDSNATIVATADLHYHFVNWTGTAADAGKVADPNAASTTVLMDANYTVVANFEANPPDTTPPTPNPLVWATVPTATGPSTITMTATTATDANSPPVQYYFECTNHGEANSTWQTSPTYIASGLTPSTQYSFRVKARDSYLTPNETGWSSTQSATTTAPSTDVNIIGSWATGTTHTKVSGTNRALVFIAHSEDDDDPNINLSSVTYGGQSMTKVIEKVVSSGSPLTRAYVVAFILNEPNIAAASGNTFTLSWNQTPDTNVFSSVFLQNVNQTTLTGASASNGTTSGNTITTSSALATSDGDMVILAATCGQAGSYTLNNGFTEANDQSFSSSTGVTGYKKTPTGSSETPSATFSGTMNRQVIIGFVVKAGAMNLPPAAPTNLTATAGNGMVSLDWNDNNEVDLAGYNVYRSMTSGSGYSKLNGSTLVSDSNYIDNSATNGIPYFYVVTAVDDANNESGYSNEASATPDYQDCSQVRAAGHQLDSDLNGDCYVDNQDLDVISYYWLNPECGDSNNCDGADFEPTDGIVNFLDFGDFAVQWMQCNDPNDQACVHNW